VNTIVKNEEGLAPYLLSRTSQWPFCSCFRASMNNSKPRSKSGKVDRELNTMVLVSVGSLEAWLIVLS